MSSLIVEVCNVDSVENHPNADRMAVARIKGWFVCVARDAVTGEPWVKPGQKVVYFPPDCVLPAEVAEKFGVAKYLGHLPKNEDGTRPLGGRVLVAKLRGVQSYGFVAPLDDDSWEVGKDVAAHYGITKYEPPLRANQGDAEKPHPAFHRYYDMENIRNFPEVFIDGEEVVCTEKIHGENCRLGLIKDVNEKGQAVWKWMAGTHEVRRKQFWYKKDKETGEPIGEPIQSASWQCFNEQIKQLLCVVSCCGYSPEDIDQEPLVQDRLISHNVVIFGERFGCVQDMHYGLENGKFTFRAFDLTLQGRYMDYNEKKNLFECFRVPMVPEVYRGPYSFDKIQELTEGPTLVTNKVTGDKNFREGIVILTTKERSAQTEKKFMDRAQLKSISFAYLNRKDGTEYH